MTAQGYHIREANQLLAQAATAPAPAREVILAEAQVHASLGVAAGLREHDALLRDILRHLESASRRRRGAPSIRNSRRD